ncbi:hypothetical protein Q4F19_00750 [Sphingomonas sp. BIUV-7]|uniref:Uncharacterized protein n=2 Tax=Sphingomonas natans TaxID=3063330 RepID=A0ABT8Y3L2_9SPHN|nr:hypothetical protein [Sphingomonas sp. BIUV-7]
MSGKYQYVTPRNPADLERIDHIATGEVPGTVVIDDFHRLVSETQSKLIDIAKTKADLGNASPLPKLVIIGINQLGESLIQVAHDIAKRLGIHRVEPASRDQFNAIQSEGERALNISFDDTSSLWEDSRGDYWLIQRLLKLGCTQNNVTETVNGVEKALKVDLPSVRTLLTADLSSAYQNITKEFCRGKRFRPGNDPYFKLLKAVSEQNEPAVDIKLLANQLGDLRQSINNIKDHRLKVLIDEKGNLSRFFHYNPENSLFSIDDQALFFYLKNLDWDRLRAECGFREVSETFEFDIAISFAGENRKLAETICERLRFLDFNVFTTSFTRRTFWE